MREHTPLLGDELLILTRRWTKLHRADLEVRRALRASVLQRKEVSGFRISFEEVRTEGVSGRSVLTIFLQQARSSTPRLGRTIGQVDRAKT